MTRREHRQSIEKLGIDPSKASQGDFPESFFIAATQADFMWDMDHVRTHKGKKADFDAYVVKEDNEMYSLISYSGLAAKRVMYSCQHIIPTNGLFRLAVDWSDLKWYVDTHFKQVQANLDASSCLTNGVCRPNDSVLPTADILHCSSLVNCSSLVH